MRTTGDVMSRASSVQFKPLLRLFVTTCGGCLSFAAYSPRLLRSLNFATLLSKEELSVTHSQFQLLFQYIYNRCT